MATLPYFVLSPNTIASMIGFLRHRESDAYSTPFADWRKATVDDTVQANLEAHPGAPIRRMQELVAKKVTEPIPGTYVFDLGQNIVGWARLKAWGPCMGTGLATFSSPLPTSPEPAES